MAKKKSGKNKIYVPTFLGAIILVIVLFAVSVFILLLSAPWEKKEAKKVEEVKVEEKKPTYRDTLKEEDVQKDVDMESLMMALNLFFGEKEEYPENLDALIPNYLDELPKVPGTNENYNYIVSPDKKNFKLSVKLGQGGEELMKHDGGIDDNLYEIGTDLKLK